MKNMDPEKLKEMAKSSGMDINTDQMAQAMNAMENLKPEQMESMMKWATRLQKCMAFCAKPYALFKWTVSTATLASLTLQRASDALGSASEIDRSKLLALLSLLPRAAAECCCWLAQVGWIPAEYRRPMMIALGSVFLYWLFLGGSRAPVPAPSPENYPPMGDDAGMDEAEVEYVDPEDEWGE